MICDTCAKRQGNSRTGYKCAVLTSRKTNRKEELPVWGPNCSAYTNDFNWEKKVNKAVRKYMRKDESL